VRRPHAHRAHHSRRLSWHEGEAGAAASNQERPSRGLTDGVHPTLVAITSTSAVDDPGRFTRSRTAGAHFGLTPTKYQSGETDVTGGISRVGDAMVRSAPDEAANVMLGRFSSLKRWAMGVATRRGMKRAKVALARKLASIMHRMWIDGTNFRFGKEAARA
jgi:transposase